MQSNVKKIFQGQLIGTLQYLKVVPDIMSPFQTESYLEAYARDRDKNSQITGFSSNSRQSSLFVFPDNSYGKTGFEKYIVEKQLKRGPAVVEIEREKVATKKFYLKPGLKNIFNSATNNEEKLEILQKYSTIYAASIRNILLARKEGKCVFVYNEFVEGGGLILFGLLLELFGFKRATGGENLDDHESRYISLTNITSSPQQINRLVKRFNNPDNVFGKVNNFDFTNTKNSIGAVYIVRDPRNVITSIKNHYELDD